MDHPRIIKTDEEYRKALEEAEHLIEIDPDPGTDEAEKLALLSMIIEKYESEKFPIELPDPIEAIKFRMKEQGLKQRDLIPFIGTKGKVSEILSGKRTLTVAMIRALHEGLNIPAEVLLQEPKVINQRASELDWQKLPIKEMIKRGWLGRDLKNWNQAIISFLQSLGGEEHIPVLCRRTLVERSGKSMDRYALLAWTARILNEAVRMEVSSFDKQSINEDFLLKVAKLSLSNKGPLEAQAFLASHGIALVVEPHLPRTHLDGAAILSTAGKPIIGLTLRHDRIDSFWFNLEHELIHVWKHLHSWEEAFVDDLDSEANDPREREADRIASEILIPRSIWKRSDAYRQRTPDAIYELAMKLEIHPAIIAGRIRHDANNYYILSQMVGSGKVRKLFPEKGWN